MNQEAIDTLRECDLILFVADISQTPDEEDQMLADLINKIDLSIPVILVLNKVDRLTTVDLADQQGAYHMLLPRAKQLPVSATRGDNLDELIDVILSQLVSGFPFFAEDQVTDLYEREIAADLIREACLYLLRDEVPHGVAIRIDQFSERGERGAYIEATIFVERDSHKGIVIGQGGNMLKHIGSAARLEIEAMSGRKIYLRLRVKVRKNWRDDQKVLRWFGY